MGVESCTAWVLEKKPNFSSKWMYLGMVSMRTLTHQSPSKGPRHDPESYAASDVFRAELLQPEDLKQNITTGAGRGMLALPRLDPRLGSRLVLVLRNAPPLIAEPRVVEMDRLCLMRRGHGAKARRMVSVQGRCATEGDRCLGMVRRWLGEAAKHPSWRGRGSVHFHSVRSLPARPRPAEVSGGIMTVRSTT
jgi:hypothetical protein